MSDLDEYNEIKIKEETTTRHEEMKEMLNKLLDVYMNGDDSVGGDDAATPLEEDMAAFSEHLNNIYD